MREDFRLAVISLFGELGKKERKKKRGPVVGRNAAVQCFRSKVLELLDLSMRRKLLETKDALYCVQRL